VFAADGAGGAKVKRDRFMGEPESSSGMVHAYGSTAAVEGAASAAPAVKPEGKPRIWTVWTAIAVVILAVIVSQILGGVLLVLWHFSTGGTTASIQTEIVQLATQPLAVMLISGLSQLAFAGVAVGAAWFSPQLLSQRLGYVRPWLPCWAISVAIVGSLVPLLIGVGMAVWLAQYVKPDPSIKLLYEKMTPAMALPFVLYIALAPGFCEETFFRGYVQRRLLERWTGWVAVLVTSVIFGIFHVMPHAILAALPLGIWLGILAWRTGSIWPGIACHAAVNGGWNVRNVGMSLGYFPKETPLAVVIGVAVVGLCAFVWSLSIMFGISASQWRHDPASERRTL
jgi:membrane protease YdiL (CAAX protease family)